MKKPLYIRIDQDLDDWIAIKAALASPPVSKSAMARYCLEQYRKDQDKELENTKR